MIGFEDVLETSSDEEHDENEQKSNRIFIDHIRKCFVAIDDNNFCEHSVLPDLKIFNGKVKKNDNLSILSKRINENAYEYVRTNKIDETGSSFAARGSKQFYRQSLLPFDPVETNKLKETRNFLSNPMKDFEIEVETLKPNFVVSPLTKMLEQTTENPFLCYAKHEAFVQDRNEVGTFNIYLPTNHSNSEINFFMTINIYKKALFSDLIGLICFKYVTDNRQPRLRYDSVEFYEFKIVDNGIIEDDLGIESNQRIAKYSIKDLVLIENKKMTGSPSSERRSLQKQVSVKIHFNDGMQPMKLEFDTDQILMEEVYKQVHKFKMEDVDLFCPKIDYRLEHIDKIGTEIDLEKCYLHDFRKKYEFIFYRLNSIRKQSSPRNSLSSLSFEMTTKGDVTRTISENVKYNLLYLGQWKKDPFNIELEKDELILEEIKNNKKSNFYTIPIKFVVDCTQIKEKNSDNTVRIIIAEEESSNSICYKHLDFESCPKVIDDLKTGISHLVEYCNSPYWNQYQATKDNIKKTKWSRKAYRERNRLK